MNINTAKCAYKLDINYPNVTLSLPEKMHKHQHRHYL